MNKTITINCIEQALELEKKIVESCDITRISIKKLANENSGINFLHDIKFFQLGKDPLNDRSLNFIEQLNQSFTYLVSIKAVIFLLNHYCQFAPYTLNLGTQSGFDIVSNNGEIVAETFAATSPTSNNKINKDATRMESVKDALHRFVFYYSPTSYSKLETLRVKYPNVAIVPIDITY